MTSSVLYELGYVLMIISASISPLMPFNGLIFISVLLPLPIIMFSDYAAELDQ